MRAAVSTKNNGQSLVEVLVTIGLCAIMLPALTTAIVASREGRAQEPERLQATALLREANEAVRSVRERSWSEFAANGTYHPAITGINWGTPAIVGGYNAAGTEDTLDVFTAGAYAYISDGSILTILDVTVPAAPVFVGSYTAPGTINDVYVEGNYAYLSTAASAAELAIVNITNPAAPTLASSLNLPGNADGLVTFVVGNYAYVGRETSGTVQSYEFQIVNVTTPSSPVAVAGIDLLGNVTDIKVNGNYAYLATGEDAAELRAVNITNKNAPTTTGMGVYNAPGIADGTDLTIDGTTTLYLATANNTAGQEVYSFGLSSPTAPSLLDTYEVGGTATGVSVANNLVFVSTTIAATQLVIIDATATNNLVLKSSLNLGANANDVRASGSYVYVASASDTQELMTVSGMGAGTWILTNTPTPAETVGNFTRQVVISDVQRNSAGVIVASGGTVDPSTKRVVTTVSWTRPIATTLTTTSYYSRYLNNAVWTQTTQAEFTAGTRTNVVVTNTAGGELQLGVGVSGINWGSPSVAGSYNVTGNTDAADVFVSGTFAYVAQGNLLQIINISNPAAPTLSGTFTATDVINGVYVAGNFAYLATAANSAELTVVNVTNPAAPTSAAAFNVGDTADGLSVFVSGTQAYVGKASGSNEFNIINVATPTAPVSLGTMNLGEAVNSIYVNGNFAYLATSIGTAELTIINVTTPATPTSAGIYNAVGTSIATDIFAVGTTIYLTRANNTSGGEFFTINAANPAAPALLGSFETGNTLNGVSVVGTNAYLATSVINAEFSVLNVTNPAAITALGAFDLNANSNDIMAVGNYAYVASTDNARELIVMQGAPVPGGYQLSGTHESSTFDAGTSVAFNNITFTITEPASTNIQFQLASNNDNATWNYTGPDGTAASFYAAPSGTAIGFPNGRYVRYKAFFSGPGTATPILSDVTLNYSP